MRRGLLSLIMFVCVTSLIASCSSSSSDKSEIAGKWNVVKTVKDGSGTYVSGPAEFKWLAEEGTAITVDLQGFPLKLLVSEIPELIKEPVSDLLNVILKDVSFEPKGAIVATYADLDIDADDVKEPNWKVSNPKLASYKVTSKTSLTLFLHIEEIIKENSRSSKIESQIMELIKEGIPIRYVLESETDTEKLYCYINKSNLIAISEILIELDKFITDDMFEGFGGTIKSIIKQLPNIIVKTNTFEVGLKFERNK